MDHDKERVAIRVSNITIVVNALLAAGKLAAGIIGRSQAMTSDAIHTLSDVLSTFVVIIGIKLSVKKSDKDHPYGHERFESVAAIVLAAMLFVTGAAIGLSSLEEIAAGASGYSEPGVIALVAAVVSIVVKEWMYWYTRSAAKRVGSDALMADAWHHRSDAFSSIGSFIGILGARLGFPILDPAAGIVICLFIIKTAIDIFRSAAGKMTDRAAGDEFENEIREVIESDSGVLGIDMIKTRVFGDRIYVDVEISADGNDTLYKSHDTARRVHNLIESQFPTVKHCMVHVNPAGESRDD